MVAPLDNPTPRPPSPAMRRAYRIVARTLLPDEPQAEPALPLVVGWKAWLLAVWAVGVTAAYVAYLVGRLLV